MKRSALLASLPTDEAERRRVLLRMLAADDDSGSDEDEEGEEEGEGEEEDEEEAESEDDEASPPPLPDLDADGRVRGYAGVDHSLRSWADALPLDKAQRAELTRDCRLVFALDSSNWLAAGARPRCSLEAIAAAVFERHTRGATYDAATSGCEWWAQVRKSGDAGEAIEFHWDVDEHWCDRHGVHVSPALSTVTYLSDVGAPTLVLEVPSPRRTSREQPDSGHEAHGAIGGGALSYPRQGKHLVFDGRLLHGAVPTRTERAADVRRGAVRVSFLVNVWLNHRPKAVEPLPASLLHR